MSIYHGYTESPEKVRARWEAWQRRAAEYEEQKRILTNITPEAHEEYIANLVHSAYGEALEDDPQRDADTQAREVENWLGTLTPEQIDFVAWATDDAADWRDEQATRQSEHPTPLG